MIRQTLSLFAYRGTAAEPVQLDADGRLRLAGSVGAPSTAPDVPALGEGVILQGQLPNGQWAPLKQTNDGALDTDPIGGNGGYITIDLADGDVNLTEAQARNRVIRFISTPSTQSHSVTLPNVTMQWVFINETGQDLYFPVWQPLFPASETNTLWYTRTYVTGEARYIDRAVILTVFQP